MKDFKQIITKFHYKKCGVFVSVFLFILLFLPAVFYSFVIKLKNLLYKLKILSEKSVGFDNGTPSESAKVICIGNLTTGGVGKTPVVIEFCRYLSKYKKVSSLSRGYGGKLKKPAIIKDFNKILIDDAGLSGDEVNLIAKNAENFAVVASSDRLAGANLAINTLNTEIIVMDDGFSNRKIKKDLTCLLFDINKFIGNGFLLPLGPLREPLREIKRADGIILIDKANTENASVAQIMEFLEEKFKKPVFVSKFKADYFYDIRTGEIIDTAEIKDIFAFCGIGQPVQFYNYLKPYNLLDTKSFDDHYFYKNEDVEDIIQNALKKGAKYIVTTEKDAVKLVSLPCIKDRQKGQRGQKDGAALEIKILAMKLKPEINVEKILNDTGFKV